MEHSMDAGRLQRSRPAQDRHEGDLLALINRLLQEAAYLDHKLLLLAELQRRPAMTEVTYAG